MIGESMAHLTRQSLWHKVNDEMGQEIRRIVDRVWSETRPIYVQIDVGDWLCIRNEIEDD